MEENNIDIYFERYPNAFTRLTQLLDTVVSLYHSGRYKEALQKSDEVLANENSQAFENLFKALTSVKMGSKEYKFIKVLSAVRAWRGACLKGQNRMKEALEEFRRSAHGQVEVNLQILEIHFESREYEQLTTFGEALKLKFENYYDSDFLEQVHFWLARAYLKIKQEGKAKDELETLLAKISSETEKMKVVIGTFKNDMISSNSKIIDKMLSKYSDFM